MSNISNTIPQQNCNIPESNANMTHPIDMEFSENNHGLSDQTSSNQIPKPNIEDLDQNNIDNPMSEQNSNNFQNFANNVSPDYNNNQIYSIPPNN